jgi:hypothetical protein
MPLFLWHRVPLQQDEISATFIIMGPFAFHPARLDTVSTVH